MPRHAYRYCIDKHPCRRGKLPRALVIRCERCTGDYQYTLVTPVTRPLFRYMRGYMHMGISKNPSLTFIVISMRCLLVSAQTGVGFR